MYCRNELKWGKLKSNFNESYVSKFIRENLSFFAIFKTKKQQIKKFCKKYEKNINTSTNLTVSFFYRMVGFTWKTSKSTALNFKCKILMQINEIEIQW